MTTKAVYEYLKIQNRPYNVNDIVTNLPTKLTKSDVQKALEKLVDSKQIIEKVYGKQKIYCIVQDSKHDANELMRIDRELQAHANEVERKLQEVEKDIREKEATLNSLRSVPKMEDTLRIRGELKESIKASMEKLDNLMEANGTQDLGAEKIKAEKIMNDYSREYTKRKRLCTEIIDCILEGYPGTKKELQNEIGIEVKIVE